MQRVMRELSIRGGRPLRGRVRVEGAKNSALKLLAASLLTDDAVCLENVPENRDVHTMAQMLQALGRRVEHLAPEVYCLSAGQDLISQAPYELVRQMRDSFTVLGPLLARSGYAEVPLPGGCNLGPRPVDFHLKGLELMGAQVELTGGLVRARAARLHGAEICLDYPSVGATAHLLMTAALVPERTVILGAAQEPEIYDLADLLREMGAQITLLADRAEIIGASALRGVRHRVIPDRIQAGTYAMAAAITGGELTIQCWPEQIRALNIKLREMGVTVEESETALSVEGCRAPHSLHIETRPYPSFATDFQPQATALLSLAQGESTVHETVFQNRFGHVPELLRMGAKIEILGDRLLIQGVDHLEGARVRATSICAGEALVLAGLAARGQTTIEDEEGHLERRYSHLADQLSELGADISEQSEISIA